jgi:two-component system chemotaxis response regulator CheB
VIRLLAVDDSALMRRLIGEIFSAEDGFEVHVARDGLEALALLHSVKPDVITLDVHMPQMDGLACLDRIMLERPCPVVMLSTLTTEGARETLEALSLGAVDFIAKPGGAISLKVEQFAPVLVEKVRAAARARLTRTHRLAERIRFRAGLHAASSPPEAPAASFKRRPKIEPMAAGAARPTVLVGCSTGGPPALDALLGPLPGSFPWPIVVAQHMPATFTPALAQRLDRLCNLTVREIDTAIVPEPGHAYIARGDTDLIFSRRGPNLVVLPAPANAAFRWHPSVDRLVDSAMDHMEPAGLVGILMTGMGNDGAAAMHRLRQRGGHTIAEAEETAVVWGMPGELVRLGGAEFVRPVEHIAEALLELAGAR